MISFTATVDLTQLAATINGLVPRLQAVVNDTARAIQADYAANAPRDTGAMAESCYVTTAYGESDYNQRASEAARRWRKAASHPRGGHDLVPLPQLPSPGAPGAVVGVAAPYAILVEHGTSRMPPRPFFTASAASEAQASAFRRRVAEVLVP